MYHALPYYHIRYALRLPLGWIYHSPPSFQFSLSFRGLHSNEGFSVWTQGIWLWGQQWSSQDEVWSVRKGL